MTLSRNLTAHASVGTTVKTDAVYTRVWWSTHFRTHSTRAVKPDIHRGQAIASTNEADRESNTRQCGKAALTGQLDKPHPSGHPCPSLGERLVLPHLLIC